MKSGADALIAIGSSADGFRALVAILGHLPATLAGSVVIVQHRSPRAAHILPGLLRLRTTLPVKEATDGEALQPGVVYVAPVDRHLVVDDGRFHLVDAPRVNLARPSIDVLFESVAKAYGPRAIGIILSGGGVDGARVLHAIRLAGGRTIVQTPEEAMVSGMPRAAMGSDGIEFVVSLREIGPLVERLVSEA
jgi:two-component system chemotaxis response regulator CheB